MELEHPFQLFEMLLKEGNYFILIQRNVTSHLRNVIALKVLL